MKEKAALLVVDLQNDFMPSGALGVLEGDQVVPVMNRYIERFRRAGLPVYLSRDWHPPVTKHFKQYGGVWPAHCVQDTPGAEFHRDLVLPQDAIVVSKGVDPEKDSYSAFDGFEADGTPLAESLYRRGVDRLYIGGLATDYCVLWTVLEGRRRGFERMVLIDGCLGVNLKPHDSERAIAEMVASGTGLTTVDRLSL